MDRIQIKFGQAFRLLHLQSIVDAKICEVVIYHCMVVEVAAHSLAITTSRSMLFVLRYSLSPKIALGQDSNVNY